MTTAIGVARTLVVVWEGATGRRFGGFLLQVLSLVAKVSFAKTTGLLQLSRRRRRGDGR